MTSSAGLNIRKKKLLYLSQHRGTREMDMIIGRFVNARIATMNDIQVSELERIFTINDSELLSIVMGDKRPPAEIANYQLFLELMNFVNNKSK